MFAYRCPIYGLQIADSADPVSCPCGERHIPYESGAKPQKGAPTVIGDHLPKYYDHTIGMWLNSKSERDREYDKRGFRVKSVKEHMREHNLGRYGRKEIQVSMANRGRRA